MRLEPGTRIGPYEIVAEVGAGGMGVVYRSRDNLKRDVALKVLPESLAGDASSQSRFQREAEILASLNHPGIAAVYGYVEGDGARAIAMEYVDGPTLPCPQAMEAARTYARQIAEALEYAHERGVVHRDLKPANIKLTSDGQVKLLDFGLAKALETQPLSSNPDDSPTMTLGHTHLGVILGTAAYMSPEQAVGKPADRRADIFSYGAVLYELFSGERAFTGQTPGETLASVVKDEPDWSKLPAGAPVALIKRCLTKDRTRRLQAIGEARIALEEAAQTDGAPSSTPRIARPWPWIAATCASLAVMAGLAAWAWLRPAAPPAQPVRFSVPMTTAQFPAISRDGTILAWRDRRSVMVRRLGEQGTTNLETGVPVGPRPCISPDNKWVAFSSQGREVRKMPIDGGAATLLVGGQEGADTCEWGEDGFVYFGANAGIARVPAEGGTADVVAPDNEATSHENPRWLPDGRLVYTSNVSNRRELVVRDLRSGATKVLAQAPSLFSYVASGDSPALGHALYQVGELLMVVAVDLDRGVASAPVRIAQGAAESGAAINAAAASGTLAYASGTGEAGLSALVWVDQAGREVAVPGPPRSYLPAHGAVVSPDATRGVVAIRTPSETDLWMVEFATGRLTRLTFGGQNGFPVWAPDGNTIYYVTLLGSREVRALSVGGSSPPRVVVKLAATVLTRAVTADGKTLLGFRGGNGGLVSFPVDGSSQPKLLGQENAFDEQNPRLSPDEKWVAYRASESGRPEIFVRAYPGPGGKAKVSVNGGTWVNWSRTGNELYFLEDDRRMMAVSIDTTGPTPRVGAPRLLFETGNISPAITPDGQRFLMLKPSDAASTTELRVVVNWFDELRRLAPWPD